MIKLVRKLATLPDIPGDDASVNLIKIKTVHRAVAVNASRRVIYLELNEAISSYATSPFANLTTRWQILIKVRAPGPTPHRNSSTLINAAAKNRLV